MELGAVLGTSWSSGLNLYLTVLLLGVAGRLGWADTPEALQQPWVLVVATALFALEFVVDKVPWLDSVWDTAHTLIRPAGAAVVAGLVAGTVGDVPTGVAAVVGAVLGLSSHSAKATTRLAANTSPEPFSNVALSLGEDGVVVAMVLLAVAYPWVAGVLAVALAVMCVVVTVALFRVARAARRRLRDRRRRRGGALTPP